MGVQRCYSIALVVHESQKYDKREVKVVFII